MAELDEKLLKNLDKTLESMNTRLTTLEQTLSGVKDGMATAFDPSVLREFFNAMRDMKAARLVDAESIKDVEKIKTIFNDITVLRKEISTGKGFRLFDTAELNAARRELAETQDIINILNNMSRAGKLVDSDYAYLAEQRVLREQLKQNISQGGAFDIPLDEEAMRRKMELLAQYKQERQNLLKGEQQRAVELANIQKQEAKSKETATNKAIQYDKQRTDAQIKLLKIEHDRELRTKTGVKATSEQIAEENKQYKALEDTIRRLTAEIQGLKGVDVNKVLSVTVPYENYSKSKENLRFYNQLQQIEEQQKKNTDETKKQEKALRDVEMTAERLKNVLVAAFGINQIKKFASEIVKVRGEFEMSEIALEHIVGNSEKTQLIWKKTMNLAVNSPLTAMQLTKATKQLAAFRVETDRLYDTTKMLADVSVGLGVDMDRLILAYGHTKSSGFLRGMYARQFATAGVNIYGELADYYTKREGHLVTFRDVYERISKKLVSFADVEKVFENITSKGGAFYNMQQVLTDTVQGQINKIKDSWQQALNDIGKSTQGTIRGVTNIILSIVKNWRVWLSVIEATTAALITFKAVNIVRALTSISYASDTASKSTKRLAEGLKSVFSNFKGNLPSTLTAIAVAAVTVFATMYKHMKDFNKEIDEQSIKLYEAQQKMHDYQKRVEANNEVIKDSTSNSEMLKAAREDNLDVLLKLQQKYPELYDGVTQQENGEVELTKKIEAHNESLREQIRLNEQLKQTSIFNDPFEKDTQQYFEQLDKWRKKILLTQKDLKLKLLRNELNADEVPMAEAIIGIDTNDIIVAIEQYNEILSGARQIISQNKDELEHAYRTAIQELSKQVGTADEINRIRFKLEEANLQKEAAERAGLTDISRYTIINTDVHAVREFEVESARMVKEMLDGFELLVRGVDKEQKKIVEDYNNNFAYYFQENKGRLLEMVTSNELDVNETIRTFLEAHGQALTDENKKVWNILLNEALLGKQEMENILKLTELSWISEQPFYKMLFKKASERLSDEGYYDFFAAYRSPTTGGDDDDTNKTYKSLDELLNLLKTMNSEYNKLSKSAYGFAKSNEMVMKVFRESFKDIFKTAKGLNKLDEVLTMINFDTVDITSKQGLANAFQELYDFLEKNSLWNQFGKDADKLRAKLQKTIDMQEVEVGMDVQIRVRDDFARQMEEAFGNYELTLELDKLNLPKDVLSDMFDIEAVDLSDLRNKVVQYYEEQVAKEADPTELVKQVEGYYKKIDEMERKQQRERLKDYAKYLEYELSERAKIEMDYVRKSAEVATTRGLTNDQKQAIDKRLKKERDEKLAKQEWEDFKSSETYIQMMEDLEHQGTGALAVMRQELERIRKNAANLSPRALKEVVNALEKIDEITIKRGMPIGNILRAGAGVTKAKEYATSEEIGLASEQVKSRKAARETLESIKKTILEREK